jgi:hypothetical protein
MSQCADACLTQLGSAAIVATVSSRNLESNTKGTEHESLQSTGEEPRRAWHRRRASLQHRAAQCMFFYLLTPDISRFAASGTMISRPHE